MNNEEYAKCLLSDNVLDETKVFEFIFDNTKVQETDHYATSSGEEFSFVIELNTKNNDKRCLNDGYKRISFFTKWHLDNQDIPRTYSDIVIYKDKKLYTNEIIPGFISNYKCINTTILNGSPFEKKPFKLLYHESIDVNF